MRFMAMHKVNSDTESGRHPKPELLEAIGRLTQEGAKESVFLSGEGLRPTATAVRLRFKNGQPSMIPGPLSGELIAGFIVLRVKSQEEALKWAARLGKIMGDVQLDVRPVAELWDIGLAPKPEKPETVRYMILNRADSETESGKPPTPKMIAQMGALMEGMKKAGVFL